MDLEYRLPHHLPAQIESSISKTGWKSGNLFCPLQPAVTEKDDHITYREAIPAPHLQPYIYCYWQLKTSQPLTNPFTYRVVADGCIDIAFDMNLLSDSVVIGFCRRFIEFPLEPEFNYVGVRFLPAMFPLVYSINASELSNHLQSLDNVLPNAAFFIKNNFQPDDTLNQIARKFDRYFCDHLLRTHHPRDMRFFNALQHILKSQGTLRIETDIDTGLSTRQIRRLFNFYIGDSPKIFSKVVRFQNILAAKPTLQSLRQNKIFYDAGYYDQSHFIKEFNDFYGVTPSKAFGQGD